MIESDLIVDTNQMIAALLRGRALDIIFSRHFRFFTTERKTWEVKRYILLIAAKTGASEENIWLAFERFPITAYQDAFFEDHKARIGIDRQTRSHRCRSSRSHLETRFPALVTRP